MAQARGFLALVAEDEREFTVKVELPGVEERDLRIEAHDGVLSIAGEKKSETKADKKNYHYRELSYGSFERQIPMPSNAASDKAQAEFAKGVLTIRIPKTAPTNGRRIEIKRGAEKAEKAEKA